MRTLISNLREGFKRVISLIGLWFLIGILFGVIYYLIPSSVAFFDGQPVTSIWDSIYFSFVTMLTIGYGDIVAVGVGKSLIILEGLCGWIFFGIIVYRIVAVKQDSILEEIHNMTNQEQISRLRNYLFISNTNITRFLGKHKLKKEIKKEEVFELNLISTTLEANIADATRFLCRERIPSTDILKEEDLLLITKGIEFCLSSLLKALAMIPRKERGDAELYTNIEKILEYNKRIYNFSNIQTSSKKIDELRVLNEKLEEYLRS